jgi:hypothetical protein
MTGSDGAAGSGGGGEGDGRGGEGEGAEDEAPEMDGPLSPVGVGLADTAAGVPAPDAASDPRPPDAADGVAYASPSLNRVEFHVHPAPTSTEAEARLVYAQVRALREELLHGERSHLGVARNVRLLDRRVQGLVEALAAVGRGDDGDTDAPARDVDAILADIESLRESRAEIERVREPVVEAVDKFHVHSLLSADADVVDELLDRRASDEFVAKQARTFIRDHERTADYDSEVYERLEELYERAGWRVAEAAATAAFDVPVLVEAAVEPARALGIDVAGFETLPTARLRELLEERFAAAVAVAEAATADLDDRASVADLAEPIREAVAESTDRPAPERTLADVELPLLDVPAGSDVAGAPPGVGESDVIALDHTETPVGYLLAGAFRTVGDFGGALYITPDGEWQWAVNPWVADEAVDVDIPNIGRYDQLWAHATVAHGLGVQLSGRGRDGRPRAVVCTLCERSPTGHCGTDGCAFADLVDGVNLALERSR